MIAAVQQIKLPLDWKKPTNLMRIIAAMKSLTEARGYEVQSQYFTDYYNVSFKEREIKSQVRLEKGLWYTQVIHPLIHIGRNQRSQNEASQKTA